MNGWQRLLIVVAAPFVLIAFLAGYNETEKVWTQDVGTANAEVANLQGQAWIDAVWRENRGRTEFKNCQPETVRITRSDFDGVTTVTCTNGFMRSLFGGIEYAFIAALVFAAIGATIGWIYRGFRPSS